eukprot:GHVO01049020.1.p1 GENE.GHVO01049020.1~~GHVO01049020.1.p1  ORF type:complete len:158 (+),score=18.01 GHVO01049020.1:132-605(+)
MVALFNKTYEDMGLGDNFQDVLSNIESRERKQNCPLLNLYASLEADMKAAVAEINMVADKECMQVELKSEQDLEAISHLNEAQVFVFTFHVRQITAMLLLVFQVRGILDLQKTHDVEIDISAKGIFIKGLTNDVSDVKTKILGDISKTKKKVRDSKT